MRLAWRGRRGEGATDLRAFESGRAAPQGPATRTHKTHPDTRMSAQPPMGHEAAAPDASQSAQAARTRVYVRAARLAAPIGSRAGGAASRHWLVHAHAHGHTRTRTRPYTPAWPRPSDCRRLARRRRNCCRPGARGRCGAARREAGDEASRADAAVIQLYGAVDAWSGSSHDGGSRTGNEQTCADPSLLPLQCLQRFPTLPGRRPEAVGRMQRRSGRPTRRAAPWRPLPRFLCCCCRQCCHHHYCCCCCCQRGFGRWSCWRRPRRRGAQ
jgi:hypothetical protein